MRYILLASLAVSELLFLLLVNSFLIANFDESWLYGDTMCQLNAAFAKYCFLNTVLHLLALSYERYDAVVKSPLTYDGSITSWKVVLISLLWIIPIPLSTAPFTGFGRRYDYNPELFVCEQALSFQGGSSGWHHSVAMMTVALFAVSFLLIIYQNWSVYKTAKSQAEALALHIGSTFGSNIQQQEMSRRIRNRKAVVDITIAGAAFLLCFLPIFVARCFRRFFKGFKVPNQVVLVTLTIFNIRALCNPIIYSVRKREFRTGVRNLLRKFGLCGSIKQMNDEVIVTNTVNTRI